jgi:hypothetical protein
VPSQPPPYAQHSDRITIPFASQQKPSNMRKDSQALSLSKGEAGTMLHQAPADRPAKTG